MCSDQGQVKWQQISLALWDQVHRSDRGQPLELAAAAAMTWRSGQTTQQFSLGHQLEEVCWLGVLSLQFWELVVRFPRLHPMELQAEWQLLRGADWSLVLLGDFPLWGVLRQAQQAVNSCCSLFLSFKRDEKR